MTALTFRNARTVIENAIVDRLALACAERRAVDSLDALIARPTTGLDASKAVLAYVTSEGLCYRWRAYSTAPIDPPNVLEPADVGVKPGRWVRTTSAVTTGYARTVDLYNDDTATQDTIDQRIFAQRPAMLLSFEGRDKPQPKSMVRGALYLATFNFQLLVASMSLRGKQVTRQGSGTAVDVAFDPGTAAMIGDAETALAGADTLGLDDVAYCEIGAVEPVLRDLANERFVESLELIVVATLTNQFDDADNVELLDLTAQRQLEDE